MPKPETRPVTTGLYKILSLPTGCRVDTPKCSRKGCANSRTPGSIWCSKHLNCGPSTSCDNLPAVTR